MSFVGMSDSKSKLYNLKSIVRYQNFIFIIPTLAEYSQILGVQSTNLKKNSICHTSISILVIKCDERILVNI